MELKGEMDKIKGRVKSGLGEMIFRSRLDKLLLSGVAVVIGFHRVNNSTVGDGLTCSVEMFERYCRFFARYFRVVSLRELVEKIERKASFERELVITFDDGYRDNYEFAAPILTRMGLPATFFVVSQFIGTESVAWWDRGLVGPQRWMSWEELRWLHDQGFEIGSHTRTHINLGDTSCKEACDEILGSRLDLEEKLSARVELFAYPYGGKQNITVANRELIKAAGFRCCCSGYGGVNSNGTDPFDIKRIGISPWFESPHHLGCEIALGLA
jgi:peptidoglycan/xylan/chitin deacetylase (PgdA/CDA1 family)